MPRGYSKDFGIVIRQFDIGEIDRIVLLFTKETGKIRAIAKGARKIGNRLGGALDKFVFSEFLFYTGRSLPVVVQAEIKKSFRTLAKSFEKWLLGNYVLYLVDQAIEEQSQQKNLLGEVVKVFSFVDKSSPEEGRKGVLKFKITLLKHLGFQPQLYNCAICNRKKERFNFWSHAEGGVICEDCAKKPEQDKNYTPLPQDTLSIWSHLLSSSYHLLTNLKLTSNQFSHVDEFSSEYFSCHLNKSILSLGAFFAKYPENPTTSESGGS